MKQNKIVILFAILLVGLVSIMYLSAQFNRATADDEKAKQIISTYIQAKGLNIRPDTEEYSRFMKGILLGEYPDLTGIDSTFIEGQRDSDLIINFAASKVNGPREDKGTDVPEAPNP